MHFTVWYRMVILTPYTSLSCHSAQRRHGQRGSGLCGCENMYTHHHAVEFARLSDTLIHVLVIQLNVAMVKEALACIECENIHTLPCERIHQTF